MLKNGWMLLVLVVVLISGCATAPNTIRLTDGDKKVVREMTIDPVMFSGLPWSPALKSGNFVTVLGVFPRTPESYAEWDPLRIRYQAIAVGDDGREYVAYAVFAGFIGCVPRYFILVEGLQKPLASIKVLTFSTLLTHAYTLQGREVKMESAKLQGDARYRKKLVLESGTSLTDMQPIRGQRRAFDGWNVYDTKAGQIITPLDPEKVKYLSGINPQYGYWQKVIGSTRGAVSLDYVSTAVGVVFDLIAARSVKAQGFDYESMMSRSQQGYNLTVFESLRKEGEKTCRSAGRSSP